MKLKLIATFTFILLFPYSVHAAQEEYTDLAKLIAGTAQSILCKISEIFIYVVGAIATVIFVYGGIRFLVSHDDPGARKNAKSMMMNAVIAIILIVVAEHLVVYLTGGNLLGCRDTMVISSCDGMEIYVDNQDFGGKRGCTGQVCLQNILEECNNFANWEIGSGCPSGKERMGWAELECEGGAGQKYKFHFVCCV